MKIIKQKINFFLDHFDLHAFLVFLILFALSLIVSSKINSHNDFFNTFYAPAPTYAALLALLCSNLFGHSGSNKKGILLVSYIFYSVLAVVFYFLFSYIFVGKAVYFYLGIAIIIFLFAGPFIANIISNR